jgi:Domain of unknown function (DUF222)/HNH endonuclease
VVTVVDPIPTGEDIAQQLIALRREIDDLELGFARLAVEFDKTTWWDYEGFNTAADWIRFNCHMTSHDVVDSFAVGMSEGEMPATINAMKSGSVGFAHVATMGRTASDVGGAFDEAKLLPLAKKLSPGRFFHTCLNFRHSVDADGYNRDQETLAEQRGLRLNTARDGCLIINGLLDPVGGAAFRSALEPLAKRLGPGDDRTREQRYADAAVELASGGKPANVQVTASLETLQGAAGAPAGEMEFSLPISSATAQRLACDSTVTRVLLKDSVVIDVGKAERTIRGARRRALNARDQHCRWPGCERPAAWCDGHHIVFWMNGGDDDLENLVLLCQRHHRMVHEGGWQLIKTHDGQIVTIAPTVKFGSGKGPD